MGKDSLLTKIAFNIVIFGGINWGAEGVAMLLGKDAAKGDLIATLFGGMPLVSTVLYLVIGISTVWFLVSFIKMSKEK